MAEKTVKTRIIMKHGTTAEWTSDPASNYNPVIPKKGEVVVEFRDEVDGIVHPVLHVGDNSNPVGDTTTAWAKAVDVPDWAKQATAPYLSISGGTMTGTITTKGIVLKSGTDYGTTLPTGSQTTGKLFFLKV